MEKLLIDSPKPILLFIGFFVALIFANYLITVIGEKLGRKRKIRSKVKEGGYVFKTIYKGTRGDSQTLIPKEGSGETGKIRIGNDFFEAVSVGKEIKPMKSVEVVEDFERNQVIKVKLAV